MKASKTMLSYLLVTLLACCLIPASALSDGPWDIERGDDTKRGVSLTLGFSALDSDPVLPPDNDNPDGDDPDGVDPDGPSLVATITYQWLNQAGFVSLAESILLMDFESRSQKRQTTSKTRRQ